MVDFIEKRLLEKVAYGATGGPEYRTEIVSNYAGYEKRNIEWEYARSKFNVSNGVKTKDDMKELIYAHRVAKGSAYGFRYKDPNDFEVLETEGILTKVVLQPNKYQLTKKYTIPGISDYVDYRKILKPVNGSIVVKQGGSPIGATIDYTTGLVTVTQLTSATITANVTRSITNITVDSNGLLTIETSVAHTYVDGDYVLFTGLTSMVELNGVYDTVTVVDATHFTISVNGSAFSPFTTTGSVILYGLTQTNPIRVRLPGHTFTAGLDVAIESVEGMTEINGKYYEIGSVTTNYIILADSDGTEYTARTTGGTVRTYPASTEFTWSGEFDVPVRFENDYLPASYIFKDLQQIEDITLIELRQA